MRDWIVVVILAVFFAFGGCAQRTEPIERKADEGFKLLAEAIQTGGQQLSAHSAQIQGGGGLVEPGYVVEFQGGLFNGVMGRAAVYVKGAFAQLQAATQSGPPNRNVESFGSSKLPPIEPGTQPPVANQPLEITGGPADPGGNP